MLTAKVVTPGLVDAHSVVGLAGALNQPHDQMQLELSSAIQPELRAIDAYNARELLVEWVRIHGVTTIHTGHAPGALVLGPDDDRQDARRRGRGRHARARRRGGVHAWRRRPGGTGQVAGHARQGGGHAARRADQGEGVRRQARGAGGQAAGARPASSRRWARCFSKELPLLVTAQRANDIMAALRIAKEFDIRIILDGAAEAYLVLDQIKAAKVPVIVHPTMSRVGDEMENMSDGDARRRCRRPGFPSRCRAATRATCPRRASCCSRPRRPRPTA